MVPVPEGALEVGEEGVVLRIGGRHHHQLGPHVAKHRLAQKHLHWNPYTREMENINSRPTFGDFVTIHTEASMQDIPVARLQSTRVQTPLSFALLNVM